MIIPWIAAEYSRTFMRLACAYLEGKTVNAVTAEELNRASGGNARGQAVTPSDASLHDTEPGALFPPPPNPPTPHPHPPLSVPICPPLIFLQISWDAFMHDLSWMLLNRPPSPHPLSILPLVGVSWQNSLSCAPCLPICSAA